MAKDAEISRVGMAGTKGKARVASERYFRFVFACEFSVGLCVL